jgi:glycosyltransferase involved in cell wall biosynthesis
MSGLVTSALEIARLQSKLGNQVTVAIAGRNSWCTSWDNVSLLSLKWIPWALLQYNGRTLDFRRHLPFLVHSAINDYDVIHGHLYLYLRGLRSKKKIVHFHASPLPFENYGLILPGMVPEHFTRVLADSDAQIAVSHFVADQLISGLNRRGNVHVVHNGVMYSRFSTVSYSARLTYRRLYHIPEDAKVILYCGEIAAEKGVVYLARAFRNLYLEVPSAYLLVVGDSNLWGDDIIGDSQAGYANLVRSTLSGEIEAGRVIFVGKKPYYQMPHYYQMSDIVVVPSICNEAFPLVPLEAQASGKPVIATRTGGMVDALNDNNSIKVTPGNVEELQAAIYKLLSDQSLYSVLAAQARLDAAKFTWEAAVQKIMAIYLQP